MMGHIAIRKILSDYKFDSVLDIGCGAGDHSDLFLKNKKKVYAVDVGYSNYFKSREKGFDDIEFIIGDFNDVDFESKQFDCVWASHILEHQRNVGSFLDKISSVTNDNGIICITVPPRKPDIVGGHVTLWNGGLLLYNLVLAGLDCSDAKILTYGYNISIIIRKQTFELPDGLSHDYGDIKKLSSRFPKKYNTHGFNGDIENLNWDD